MQVFLTGIFALELALLFTHEMDAVRAREWKMVFKSNAVQEAKAYRVFLLLHIPLYAAVLFLLLSPHARTGFYIVDTFLIAHMFVHLIFRKHPANGLNSAVSKGIINLSGVLALIHLICISI